MWQGATNRPFTPSAVGPPNFSISGPIVHGSVITVTANQPFFFKSYGNAPQAYDAIDHQVLNGVVQNAYAGLTDGQSVGHLVWQNQSSDNGAPPLSYYTSRPKRTPFDTAVLANVNMTSQGKGWLGLPPWPAPWGAQNNQTLYISFDAKAKNTGGAAGGGDASTKFFRITDKVITPDSPNICYAARGGSGLECPFSQVTGSSWGPSLFPGGQWQRIEGNFDHARGIVEWWLSGKYLGKSNSSLGGFFEYCHPADVLYAVTNKRTDTYWAPELYGNTITAVTAALIGYDDGHGLSVGQDYDFARVYVDPDLFHPLLANSAVFDNSPTSTMQSEPQFEFTILDSQHLQIKLYQGNFVSPHGLDLHWRTGRNTAQLMGVLP